jgi:hypothetical protein
MRIVDIKYATIDVGDKTSIICSSYIETSDHYTPTSIINMFIYRILL